MHREIKICYIGGGSKLWARVFMSDLAVAEGLSGGLGYQLYQPNEHLRQDLV